MVSPEEAVLDSDLLAQDSMLGSSFCESSDVSLNINLSNDGADTLTQDISSIDYDELILLLGDDSKLPLSGNASYSQNNIDNKTDMHIEDLFHYGIDDPENKEPYAESTTNMKCPDTLIAESATVTPNRNMSATKHGYRVGNTNFMAGAAETRPTMSSNTTTNAAAARSPNGYDENRAVEDETSTSSTMTVNFKADVEWNQKFSELKEFKAQTGHTNVPQKYPPNTSLGQWVARQRLFMREWENNDIGMSPCMMLGKEKYNFSRMNIHYRMRSLSSIGFSPDIGKGSGSRNAKAWEKSFASLVEYKDHNGHCNVPSKCTTHKSLGSWVAKQRLAYKKHARDGIDQMPSNKRELQKRLKKLESIGFKFRIGSGNRPRK